METVLNSLLEPQEKVLWFGRPEKSKLLEAYDRKHQFVLWGVMAAFLILTLAVVFPYMIKIERPPQVLAIAFAVINAVPVIMAIRPWMDQRLLEGKTVYAVTDRRVIAVVKESVYILPRLGTEWIITHRDGACGNLRFGAAAYAKDQDDRADAVLGVIGSKDGRSTSGLVFYHIADVDSVAGLLQNGKRTAA
ncbi:MAG: hypothetical protein ACOX67_05495 [Oscillospiraceae bacterium]|jgi:hypothetical protein|uniref:hypothetical protein n=1 Tax=Candidatus Pseudoscillospira sp. SGI.172 TaxID=3420582 RepID=UPI0009BB9377|nr:hypothetical protein [Pseudoflavonifractor sp.]MDY3019552.1 hypothetical protein [Oscillospiraceae bacterium]